MSSKPRRRSRLISNMLLAAGTIALAIGLIGVIVPVLPTVPFLLLAAACYGRSSRRLYVWLHLNPLFGPTLRRYSSGRGISRKARLVSQGLVALSIGSSIWFALAGKPWWAKGALVLVGLAVIVHIGLIKPAQASASLRVVPLLLRPPRQQERG
jgi:uncharacterized membrane protein YbaN (DUF454 family)